MGIKEFENKILKGSLFTAWNYDETESIDELEKNGYPYSMICYLVDDKTTIAIGTGEESPSDFMDENRNSSFILDTSIEPKEMLTMNGKRTVYYAKKVQPSQTNNKNDFKLEFVFKSSDHLRYESGIRVSGPHGGAGRAIKVEPSISGGQGVTVTLYNLDGNHPVWQNNIQMAPKQMKVIESTNDKIVLRGYGQDSMGASFADYGLTINLQNGQLYNCVLHLHDSGVDIEYLP